MKQRRTIVIIGGLALLLLFAAIGLAVYFMRELELAKNKLMIKPAANKRWGTKEEPGQRTTTEDLRPEQNNETELRENITSDPPFSV